MIQYRKVNAERLDIDKALAYLTLDEKIRMLSGGGMWYTYATGEIPRVRMSDGPNGLRITVGATGEAVPATCYPTPGMLANSWDPALCYAVGASVGKEATALGVNLLLAPGVNIKRDPRGGRNFEYFSEDPVLSGEMGRAFISGVQSTGVGACVKHFAANNQEYMRMYSDSAVDLRTLHEVYLRPFMIAMDAQPAAVMCAYNKVRGEYSSESELLLKDILRRELKFDGVVISDWGAVRDRAASLKAGVDIAMPYRDDYFESVKGALEKGEITVENIDDSVRRILALIDDVYLEPCGEIDPEDGDRVAYNAAAASAVLLKNESGFLPLTRNLKVAVCGYLAENAPIQGGGSSHVNTKQAVSFIEAFSMRGIDVTYSTAFTQGGDESLFDEAIASAEDCDAVIVFVGQDAPCEGVDRESIELPDVQNKFINAITAKGKRVAVVLCSAGPVRMPWINRVYSVLYAGLNGQAGALAAVDVLYGRINPCGKLAETFVAAETDIPTEINKINPVYRESIFVGYRYYDAIGVRPLFPFGHGLSFSEIRYDGIKIIRTDKNSFEVHVTLSNLSARDAYEIVQVYVSDKTGRVMCAKKQLAAYSKVFVEGQTQVTAKIKIRPRYLEFFNIEKNAFDITDGEYAISVGASATDIKFTKSVKVDGGFFGNIPCPDAYKLPLRKPFTDEDYIALPGAYVPEERPAFKRGEFTLHNCIDDMRSTFIGKIMRKVVLGRAKSVGPVGSPERAAFIASATATPLASAAAMSDGEMTPNMAKGIVHLANGKVISGIKLLLKKK